MTRWKKNLYLPAKSIFTLQGPFFLKNDFFSFDFETEIIENILSENLKEASSLLISWQRSILKWNTKDPNSSQIWNVNLWKLKLDKTFVYFYL